METMPAPDQTSIDVYLSAKDYWYAFVSAAAGTALGIAWGWWQLRRTRTKQLTYALRRLVESIDSNVALIEIAKDKLTENPPAFPNFPFDSNKLDSWISACQETLDDKLVRDLDWQRFQLEHIAGKFALVNGAVIAANGNINLPPHTQQYLQMNAASLLTHLNETESALRKLQAKVPAKPPRKPQQK